MIIELPYSIIQLRQQVDNCWKVCNSESLDENAVGSIIHTLFVTSNCIKEDLTICRQVKEAGEINLQAAEEIRNRASMLNVELPVTQNEYEISIKISEAEQCESVLRTMSTEVAEMLRQMKADISPISADTSDDNGWQKVYTKVNIDNKRSYGGTDYGGTAGNNTYSADTGSYSHGNHGTAASVAYSSNQGGSSFDAAPQTSRRQPEYSGNSGPNAYNVSQNTIPRGSISSNAYQNDDTVKKNRMR